jgi:hypothetical protein
MEPFLHIETVLKIGLKIWVHSYTDPAPAPPIPLLGPVT